MCGEIEWLNVRQLAREGHSFRAISRMLSINRRTVKKLFFLSGPPCAKSRQRSSLLDDYSDIMLRLLG